MEGEFFYSLIDTNAKNLDRFWKKGEDNFQTYILPILQKYSVVNGTCVDFGCGIGRHTYPLARYFKKVLGVDISNHMIERARAIAHKKNINNVQFIQLKSCVKMTVF